VAAHQLVRQRGHDTGDNEVPHRADTHRRRWGVAVRAGGGWRAPREQAGVFADVAGDPEQREVALVGADGYLARAVDSARGRRRGGRRRERVRRRGGAAGGRRRGEAWANWTSPGRTQHSATAGTLA
jgi:hypothetical protein